MSTTSVMDKITIYLSDGKGCNSNNQHEIVDISSLPSDIIDYVIVPFMDVKVLHYLKCTNSRWKEKIEGFIEKLVPKFGYYKR